MKHLISIMLASLMLLGISCKEGNKKEEGPSQMERVLAIHDEVMPKMGELGKLVGQLKERVETSESSEQYEMAMRDLQKANVAMMDWMKAFGDRFSSEEILNHAQLSEEKKLLLAEEEEKVKALKDQITSAMARAKALLAQKD